MGSIARLFVAGLCALVIALATGRGSVHATGATPVLRVLHDGQPVEVLVPGATVTGVVSGLDGSHRSYCLGLASLGDRYGVPISLGPFRPVDDGIMIVHARVPLKVFPAVPAGKFVLYAGRCTNVAPDGNYASLLVSIVPGLG